MSLYVECDWCGAELHDKDRAVLPVTIKRQRPGRLDAQWAEEVRPTRHFCVGESYDMDRLGLPDGFIGDDACCYQRAMAAACGLDTDQLPNLGMEWRLVPVDTPTGRPEGVATSPEPARGRDQEFFDRMRDAAAVADGPGGIGHLPVDSTSYWILRRADLLLIEQVESKTDRELLALPRVGPKRLEIIRTGIATWRLTSADPRQSEGAA